MTNQELEARLKKAIEAQAPNDLEGVLSRCGQQEGSVVTMKKKNNRIFIGAAAAVACLALALGVGYTVNSNRITSLVSLDVNPSIELDLNKKDRVVKADALNADAEAVMDGMDLKGVPAEVAVNALIGSMVKNGYVSQDANSVLISVQNADPKAAAELRQRLDAAASQSMREDDVQGAVVSQVVNANEELTKKASEYGISAGRVQFIEELTRANEALDFDQLASRTVNDLTLLAGSQNADTHTNGTVSDGKYVGREAAQKAAFQHAGIAADKAAMVSTEFDMENGQMVYEVEFCAGSEKFECDVDAVTGKVLKMQKKAIGTDVANLAGENKAQDAAIAHAGVTPDAGTLKTQLDTENGKLVYEVEFISGGMEYEYKLDAATGAVLKAEKEIADPNDAIEDKLDALDDKYDAIEDKYDDLDDKYDVDDKYDAIEDKLDKLEDKYDDLDDKYDDLDDKYEHDDRDDDLEDALEDLFEHDDDDDEWDD